MSGFLFGYIDIGLRALSAAQVGLEVAGNNISNVNTPGFARRRVEFASGFPIRGQGGVLDLGVRVDTIRRLEDRFLQANLDREQGRLAGSKEFLRGLQQVEVLFGNLDQDGVSSLYADFSDRFAELAGKPEDETARRIAITAADSLAQGLRDVSSRLVSQRRTENSIASALVDETNSLAEELATLNREIFAAESGGLIAAPLRDERARIVGRLSELTGGNAVPAEDGRVGFALGSIGTLVTGDNAILLSKKPDANGIDSIDLGGRDVTTSLRGGELGAVIAVRDNEIPVRQTALDTLAIDLITRTNAILTSGTDLDGNPGVGLFEPDPAGAGAATQIRVSSVLLNDPRALALSNTGAPGDGDLALAVSEIRETASAALNNQNPGQFFANLVSEIGNTIAQADVSLSVSEGLVTNLQDRRDSVSGISLDEEAIELIRHQRAYEAAARFVSVLTEVTEIAVSIGR